MPRVNWPTDNTSFNLYKYYYRPYRFLQRYPYTYGYGLYYGAFWPYKYYSYYKNWPYTPYDFSYYGDYFGVGQYPYGTQYNLYNYAGYPYAPYQYGPRVFDPSNYLQYNTAPSYNLNAHGQNIKGACYSSGQCTYPISYQDCTYKYPSHYLWIPHGNCSRVPLIH